MRVKTFAEACKALNVDPKSVDVFKTLPKEYRRYMTAMYKLTIITQAINDSRKANWNDKSEPKYFPWVEPKANDKHPSGFGFSYTYCDDWYAFTSCGSRLSFRNSDDCLYAMKQFEALYIDIFLYTK